MERRRSSGSVSAVGWVFCGNGLAHVVSCGVVAAAWEISFFAPWPARPSRKARTRSLASGALCAMAAMMRFGEEPLIRRLLGDAWQARASGRSWSAVHWWQCGRASSKALASDVPCGHQVLRKSPCARRPAALYTRPVSIMSVMRAAPIRRGMRTAPPPPTKMPRRTFGQGIKRRFVGHTDVAGTGQLQPAAYHRAVQSRHHGHRALLDAHRVRRATCANASGPGRRRARTARTDPARRRSGRPRRR
jgi:hypothetical protein